MMSIFYLRLSLLFLTREAGDKIMHFWSYVKSSPTSPILVCLHRIAIKATATLERYLTETRYTHNVWFSAAKPDPIFRVEPDPQGQKTGWVGLSWAPRVQIRVESVRVGLFSKTLFSGWACLNPATRNLFFCLVRACKKKIFHENRITTCLLGTDWIETCKLTYVVSK